MNNVTFKIKLFKSAVARLGAIGLGLALIGCGADKQAIAQAEQNVFPAEFDIAQ